MKSSALLLAFVAGIANMAQAADPALLALAPADTKVVVGVQADRVRNSPFGQWLLNRVGETDAGFARFIAATGFDPRRDLREIIMYSPNTTRVAGQSHQSLVAARGVFNGTQVLAAGRAEGGVVVNYRGVDILRSNRENEKGAVAFFDNSLAVAGDEASVRAAIDRRSAPATLDARLLPRVNSLSANSDAWYAGLGFVTPPLPGLPGGGNAPGNTVQSIEQSSGGVRFGTLVVINGEAIARSAQDATALVDVSRFLAGMATLNRDRNPQAAKLAEILQGLVVQAQGTTVTYNLSVAQADIEALVPAGLAGTRAKKMRAAAK